jgi:hypothetical protein
MEQENGRAMQLLRPQQPTSSANLAKSAEPEWQMALKTKALLQLSRHYHTAGMTPEAFKSVLTDFLSDLQDVTPQDFERACTAYRMDGQNRFFPTPGQLRAAIAPKESPRLRLETFRGYPGPKTRSTLSVAEVLRKHGHEASAARWEERQKNLPKT